MRLRQLGLSALLLPALGPSPRAQEVPLTEADLPRLVRERNADVGGAAMLAESAAARAGHLGRSWAPTLKAEGGGERFQTGRYPVRNEPYGSAEAGLNLFRGGRDAIEGEVRAAQGRAARASARSAFLEALQQARREYWSLVSARELARAAEDELKQNSGYLEMAERRIRAGLTSQSDRLAFEIYRSQLNEELESLRHEAQIIQIGLAALLGLGDGARLKTEQEVPHQHEDALLTRPFEAATSPAVSRLAAGGEAAAAQGRQAARWWAPSLDLYGGYYLYTLRDRDYLSRSLRDDAAGGVRVSLPLFDGLRSRAESNSLSLQARALERQAAQAARALGARAEQTKEEMKHLHELIHNGEDRLEQGARLLERILEEYRRGLKSSFDVLTASQQRHLYRRQYAERKRDYQLAKGTLLALLE